MRKLFFLLALAITLVQFNAIAHAADNSSAAAGMPLWSQEGRSLGHVYEVSKNGAIKLMIDGRLVTVPATTLSVHGGIVTTSLKTSEVYALR